jgi:APA family basic amino acid/polyamine antiporter
MIAVLWAYEGWQYATFAAGETKDPQRVIPRGLALGTGAIIVIYLLANVGYLAALGTDRAAASDHVAADAVSAVLGGGAAKLITVVILISMVSAANGITLTVPRMYYAMARDGLFFRRLADVHPRFGTPAIAIVSGSLWAMIFAATGTFEQLLTYVVFVSWIFYGLGGAAVFVFRRREPASTRPFLVPGYPITPLLFVASAAAIVLNTVVVQPGKVWVAGALLVAGLPAYWWWRKGGRDRGQESARPVVEP